MSFRTEAAPNQAANPRWAHEVAFRYGASLAQLQSRLRWQISDEMTLPRFAGLMDEFQPKVPSPRHKYGGRDPDLAEISLRF